MLKLGVNIDHVATLRQARLGTEPRIWAAALEAERGGADGITVHLREDRRHIQEYDLYDLKRVKHIPLNLEMALHPEIVRIALKLRPEKVCIVPENRRELTTEGGLSLTRSAGRLRRVIPELRAKGIEVSLFIDPVSAQIRKAAELGADAVELHTGVYAGVRGAAAKKELGRLRAGTKLARRLGLIVNAGHGLDYGNVRAVARIPGLCELNIGHSIVARAVFTGLRTAVRQMKALM